METPPAPPDAPGGNTPNWGRRPHGRPGTETRRWTLELHRVDSHCEISNFIYFTNQTLKPPDTRKELRSFPILLLF